MIEISCQSFLVAQESVRTEGLHETLGGALVENLPPLTETAFLLWSNALIGCDAA